VRRDRRESREVRDAAVSGWLTGDRAEISWCVQRALVTEIRTDSQFIGTKTEGHLQRSAGRSRRIPARWRRAHSHSRGFSSCSWTEISKSRGFQEVTAVEIQWDVSWAPKQLCARHGYSDKGIMVALNWPYREIDAATIDHCCSKHPRSARESGRRNHG
jgi:hypothetical protein